MTEKLTVAQVLAQCAPGVVVPGAAALGHPWRYVGARVDESDAVRSGRERLGE